MLLKKILELCKERNITVSYLEKACDLGNATIRGWEKSSPSSKNLKKVADYLGVSVDSLLEKEE